MNEIGLMNEVHIEKQDNVINSQNFTCVVIAITIFLSIDPFFVWSSFAGGIGGSVFKILQMLSIVLMIFRLKEVSVSTFFCGLSILGIFLFYCLFTGRVSGTTHPLLIGNVLIYLFYALNVMTDRNILIKSFDLLRTFFAVTLGYTLIIYILLLLNVPIPYSILQSGEAGRVEAGYQFYHNYLGCILINESGSLLYRFAAVFTEPGVVGTFSAFFLAAGDLKIKKSKKDIIFLISGILSFSVAFYLMIVFFYVLKSLRNGGFKLFIALLVIVSAYSVFVNVEFSNPELQMIQERLTLTEEGLAGDNRMKEMAENAYQAFLKSDLKTVLFGYGYPNSRMTASAWQASTSYKESVYCLGVLGYGLMIFWFISTPCLCFKSNNPKENHAMYSYIVIFILSQYQRPYMKSLFLVYILIAGCLYIQQNVKTADKT